MVELLSGNCITNTNRSSDMYKSRFCVCPVCGNVIASVGEALVMCCGITLPPMEAEEPDEEHRISVEKIEDEYFVSVDHPMTKDHYISFIAAVSDSGIQLSKMYPESNAETGFRTSLVRYIYAYCNRHGLYRVVKK